MTYNLSACVFIRNNFDGAFCLFESLAMLLHLADEFLILDLGSTDGTLEALREIEAHNPKVKVITGEWPVIDAGVFATLANDLVAQCRYDKVLYYQSDEIWHEDLLARTEDMLRGGSSDLSFWRIQYGQNFSKVRWFPHLVHRIGTKDNFNFVGDGMSTDRTFAADLCSEYGGEWFPRWGGLGDEGIKPYVNDMIMDVSQLGGFLENIIERRALHAPFWHESPNVEQQDPQQWIQKERANPVWYQTGSPFNLPAIMRYHVGKTRYELRSDLLFALKSDRCREYIADITEGWR